VSVIIGLVETEVGRNCSIDVSDFWAATSPKWYHRYGVCPITGGQHCPPVILLTTNVSRATKACWHAGTRSRPAAVLALARRRSDILPGKWRKDFYRPAIYGRRQWVPRGVIWMEFLKSARISVSESWQIVSRWRWNERRERNLGVCHDVPGDIFITNSTLKSRSSLT